MITVHSSAFFEKLKLLRSHQTEAELALWKHLRANRFRSFKFRRQMVIDQYIVDFCCPRGRLIIEVDGGHHQEQEAADLLRTQHLNELGFRVMRFWNHEVLSNIESVLDSIDQALTPSPFSGEGARRVGEGS